MTEANLTDVATLRSRARQNVENGAVTEGYDADREEIIRLLNASLATELVCVLRYKRHYFMASGIKAAVAAQEFLEHATQEAEHADKLAERIVQLGGEPVTRLVQVFDLMRRISSSTWFRLLRCWLSSSTSLSAALRSRSSSFSVAVFSGVAGDLRNSFRLSNCFLISTAWVAMRSSMSLLTWEWLIAMMIGDCGMNQVYIVSSSFRLFVSTAEQTWRSS